MIKDLPEFFKGISDLTRQRIINILIHQSPVHVNHLCQILREPQSKISRHLNVLRNTGWVSNFRRDQWIYYRLHPDINSELLNVLQNIFNDHLQFQNDLKTARNETGVDEKNDF
ncbi:MAG: winged helix-turn-helix transcriptional regulator [Calditrichaeota bacterium]|nr:winged helix-turn-helix transcriptional regulator [Calditrichota bacterium]